VNSVELHEELHCPEMVSLVVLLGLLPVQKVLKYDSKTIISNANLVREAQKNYSRAPLTGARTVNESLVDGYRGVPLSGG
jgi:hypothetical protein